MKKLGILLLMLCLPAIAAAQFSSDVHTAGTLTASCSNANSTCNGTAGSSVEYGTTGFGAATVTVNGTYSGVTISFEFSDDGITWQQNTCTRTDAAIQEINEALPSNQTRAWDCGVAGSVRGRIRASAYGSGTVNVGVTTTAASIEPAPTVQLSINGSTGSNACANPHATISSAVISLSGTTATQFIALVVGQRIYLCSVVFGNGGGTTPTFSLQYGTGANCGTGTVTILPAVAIPAGTAAPIALPQNFFSTPAGQAACYILSGTAPTGTLTVSYVQQ